jgi:hypothetical protein
MTQAWQTAVSRLNQIGVFADEERVLASLPTLRGELTTFESTLRSKGYTGGALEIDEIDQPRNGVTFLIFDKAKLSDVHSAEVAWEHEYHNRWHKRVQDSVQDWLKRLHSLKNTMQGWLPSGLSIVDRPPIPMNEGLMRKFSVPPADMPTFDVQKGSNRVMRVQPKGLWIIGANGRVDLTTATASYILVDQSPQFSGAPDWRYYTSVNKRQLTPLDRAHFVNLLN